MRAGDVLLVQGENWEDVFIRWGQRLHFRGPRKRYAKYTHCALITDDNGGVIEAVSSGTRLNNVDHYKHPVICVNEKATDFMRALAVSFTRKKLGNEYGYLTILGIGIFLLTGGKIDFTDKDSYICSQLVGEALIRECVEWPVALDRLTPADIAEHFNAP